MNKVIEIETEKTLQYFDESEVNYVKEVYEGIGHWDSVQVEKSGDILLFKEFNF